MQYNKSEIYFSFMTKDELIKEFLLLSNHKNEFPTVNINVVYVFSGVEKNRLVGSSLDRLKAGIEIWEKLSVTQNQPPIFLFRGSTEWYFPVKNAFDKHRFGIPKRYLRLELVKSWKSTLDQFLQIPGNLSQNKNWLIVTSPWHLPRVRRYRTKYWPDKKVFYWTSPYRKSEFDRYQKSEITKIIRYAQAGDL